MPTSLKQLYYLQTIMFALLFLSTVTLYSHGGHHHLIQVKLNDNNLRLDTYLSAKALTQFDSNQDSYLSQQEYSNQLLEIKLWIKKAFLFQTKTHAQLKPTLFDLPIAKFRPFQKGKAIDIIHVVQHYQRPKNEVITLKILPLDPDHELVIHYGNHQRLQKNLDNKPLVIQLP